MALQGGRSSTGGGGGDLRRSTGGGLRFSAGGAPRRATGGGSGGGDAEMLMSGKLDSFIEGGDIAEFIMQPVVDWQVPTDLAADLADNEWQPSSGGAGAGAAAAAHPPVHDPGHDGLHWAASPASASNHPHCHPHPQPQHQHHHAPHNPFNSLLGPSPPSQHGGGGGPQPHPSSSPSELFDPRGLPGAADPCTPQEHHHLGGPMSPATMQLHEGLELHHPPLPPSFTAQPLQPPNNDLHAMPQPFLDMQRQNQISTSPSAAAAAPPLLNPYGSPAAFNSLPEPPQPSQHEPPPPPPRLYSHSSAHFPLSPVAHQQQHHPHQHAPPQMMPPLRHAVSAGSPFGLGLGHSPSGNGLEPQRPPLMQPAPAPQLQLVQQMMQQPFLQQAAPSQHQQTQSPQQLLMAPGPSTGRHEPAAGAGEREQSLQPRESSSELLGLSRPPQQHHQQQHPREMEIPGAAAPEASSGGGAPVAPPQCDGFAAGQPLPPLPPGFIMPGRPLGPAAQRPMQSRAAAMYGGVPPMYVTASAPPPASAGPAPDALAPAPSAASEGDSEALSPATVPFRRVHAAYGTAVPQHAAYMMGMRAAAYYGVAPGRQPPPGLPGIPVARRLAHFPVPPYPGYPLPPPHAFPGHPGGGPAMRPPGPDDAGMGRPTVTSGGGGGDRPSPAGRPLAPPPQAIYVHRGVPAWGAPPPMHWPPPPHYPGYAPMAMGPHMHPHAHAHAVPMPMPRLAQPGGGGGGGVAGPQASVQLLPSLAAAMEAGDLAAGPGSGGGGGNVSGGGAPQPSADGCGGMGPEFV
ncbi:hypothetical protein GPECTOR_92g605 [Gonium pectorale]|uniref:Uncharacterized protein n=1 Tax=Gonium pectorale TaxID=33097 RepID=A0A150G0K4_GONPE|nr:hypothetical protein GPECTOR_92g605 [Gonium pectorale]|eukprot:KXZ43382.1 hypothetical protein GPECTOR_92g605 [Gonium pectorale]